MLLLVSHPGFFNINKIENFIIILYYSIYSFISSGTTKLFGIFLFLSPSIILISTLS